MHNITADIPGELEYLNLLDEILAVRRITQKESEFYCFEKVATIVEVNFSNELNEWLYGSELGSIINIFNSPSTK
ncbi:MAG: hypothetical protein KBA08_03395 [Firmicutes bacterium]|nr:hypothetical protein [Bacillota bacterium]